MVVIFNNGERCCYQIRAQSAKPKKPTRHRLGASTTEMWRKHLCAKDMHAVDTGALKYECGV
jgi:hypothetical protein